MRRAQSLLRGAAEVIVNLRIFPNFEQPFWDVEPILFSSHHLLSSDETA